MSEEGSLGRDILPVKRLCGKVVAVIMFTLK